MEAKNSAIPNKDKKSRRRFMIASAAAVVLVSAAAAGIVLASQMRLQTQAGEIGAQVDRGPRVLVEPIHPGKARAVMKSRSRFAATSRRPFTQRYPAT